MNIQEKIDLINSNSLFCIVEYKTDMTGNHIFRTNLAKTDSERTYYSIHYSEVMPVMGQGVVRCENTEDANAFLDLVIDRIQSQVPFTYTTVEEAEQAIRKQIVVEVVSCLTDGNGQELPFVGDQPYWLTIKGEKIICVTEWATPIEDSEVPSPPIDGAVWLGSESIFDYEYGYDLTDYPLSFLKDSLEFYLLRQRFVCDDHGYAYESFDVVVNAWALPHPDNLTVVGESLKEGSELAWWIYNNPHKFDRWLETVSEQELTSEQCQTLERIKASYLSLA